MFAGAHATHRSLRRRTGRSLGVVVVAFALSMVALPLTPAQAAISSSLRRYPYLTDLVTANATVNWATTTSVTTGSVAYGRVGAEACTAHAVGATRTSITVGSTAEYQWKAMLSGLEPDAAYCYRVFGGSTDLLGTDAAPTFRSQVPAGSSTPYSFVVFGDSGLLNTDGTNPDEARLMALIAASGARFAVTTGDNPNGSGSQTDYGDLVQTGSSTGSVFGPSFWKVPGASIPMFTAVGNHGFSSVPLTNWPQDRAVAGSGGRYQMDTYCCANGTSSKSYPSMWYAFDAGPARFYVLEAAWSSSNVGSTNLYDNDYDAHWLPTSPEYRWLAADLAAHPTAVKFAFFHFPLYSANATETSDTSLSGPSRLEGLLGANGVDIVFGGHAHIYDRNLPSATGMPVTYVSGGAGAKLEPVSRCTNVAYAIGWSYSSSTHGSACGSAPRPSTIDRVFHFLLVTVNGPRVTVTPTDELGRTFDVQTYTFGGGGAGDLEAPTPPTNLAATPSTGRVSLTWSASTDDVGVTGYRVVRDGATIATVGGTTTSYADTTVAASTTYAYVVRAFDAAGNTSDVSNTASATTPPASGDTQPPTAPTGLSATAAAGQASLAWGASTDNVGVTGYHVVRDGTTIATVGGTTRSYVDTSVAPATTYSYVVRAFDAAGNTSDPSNAASATTPPATGSQLVFGPTDDAYVRSDAAGSNFGSATTLQTDGDPVKDFLMRFNVSGVGSKTITSATLRLYCVDSATAGGTFRPTATTTWTENTVTWGTAPAAVAGPTASLAAVTAGTWVTLDVKAFVSGDGVVSFRVSSTSSNGADYTSSEGAAAFAPQLIVTTG